MTKRRSQVFVADLAAEERVECIGMWCYLYDRICDYYGEPEPPTFEGIIAGYEGDEEEPVRVLVRHPDPEIPLLEYEPCYVQPRFDLPRAWNPDGTPVVADPEEYTVSTYSHLTNRETSLPPGTKVRRWVSDWEEIE